MGPARAAILIPVRDAERFLGETTESALASTERDLEIVVVDDGSTDRTAEVAAAYAARDPRVRLLRREHEGIAAARNAGVRASRAPFLCFLDGDDLLPPDHVERHADFLAGHPGVGVVYSRVVMFRDGDLSRREPYGIAEDGAALAEELLRGGVAFPQHCALVRREWFERIGGFDGRFLYNEDTHFWLRLVLAGCRFAFRPGPPVLYRRHSAAWSADLVRVVTDRMKLLDWLGRRFPARDMTRRDAVRSRKRYLTLVLSGALAARGRSGAARAEVLRSLRWSWRPGHVLEALRLLAVPGAVQRR